MNRPEWLPEKLDIKLYDSWMKFLEDAYKIFVNDFCSEGAYYNSIRIDVDLTDYNGFCEGFRHIAEGGERKFLAQSTNTLKRVERIGWPRPIIEHSNL